MSIGSWFRTDFDEPSVAAPLPLELTSGSSSAIVILDQMIRGTGIVGRVNGEFGAVAIKVNGTGAPVRVTVSVGLDEMGTRWWSDRVRPSRLAPELPRLVMVRVQGRIRGALVLARRQGWRGAAPATATLGFDLPAGELQDEGMLIVELAEPSLPSWAAPRLSARAAIGLRINSVSVREQATPAPVSGPAGHTGCDFAVAQPGRHGAYRLEVAGVPAAPPLPVSPRNRWTRQKPARAVFKLSRAARRVAVRAVPHRPGELAGVLATDLITGEPVPVEVAHLADGAMTVRFAAPVPNPVLLGSAQSQPTLSWRLAPEGTPAEPAPGRAAQQAGLA
ncbi:hypothetical protein [Actinoplanes teichomyceticus]|uniref:Uncharacterized protein n=1 Tax=Actinoplanes teichomyceticus TaxID=1867 RepID=A0A561WSM2_ACTTI|nr:hypothetical protein [Actinoplanes teichomyceticus]TWG26846.1 hypothetical protein FHX34_1011846 [Actinoplanes teichomyceticus]GIF15245.1 hypothetical protein Ate01nite_52770 [Actinoplanes teichomyceticus]